MDNHTTLLCIEVMDNMLERPVCSPFLADIDNITLQNNKSKINVKVQKSLLSIQKKLENREYPSPSAWYQDVIDYWEDVIAQCNDYIKICVQDLEQSFKKDYNKRIIDTSNLEKKFIRKINKLEGIQDNPPTILFQEFMQNNKMSIKDEITKALEEVNDEVTINGIIAIARAIEPYSVYMKNNDLIIEFRQCSLKALEIIRNYIIKRYKKLNKDYPNSY